MAEMGDSSRVTWLESDFSRQIEDMWLAWLAVIKYFTWLWLAIHDLRLDLDLHEITWEVIADIFSMAR